MYSNNYKNLPYKQSVEQFIKDYFMRYTLYGRYTYWETKEGYRIRVKDIHKCHLYNIVAYFGSVYIRKRHPYVWYRYLKEFESDN